MTPEADPWKAVSAARLPAAGLAALAAVRHLPGIDVQLDGDVVWVHWPAGRIDVVRCLLPVAGLRFYRQVGDEWVPFNGCLPTSERPPFIEKKPLAGAIVPDRLEPRAPTDSAVSPVRLGAVRGGPPKPATALIAPVRDLAAWADTATTRELARVRAALCGDRAALLGENLPSIPNAVRYWGDGVFVPLGFQTEPALPAETVRKAVGAEDDELVFLNESDVEIVPRSTFAPATRAAVRLALSPSNPGDAVKPHERANAYLAIPPGFAGQLGGLRWSFTHDGILDSDGRTFVLVEELSQILDGTFARPPVPPFAYVLAALHLLTQCTDSSRIGTVDAYKKNRSAVGFPRNVGLLIAELCRELPAAVAPPGSAEVRLALDDRLRFGRQSMPEPVAEPSLAPNEVERTLAAALFKLGPEALVSWLRTGAPPNAEAAERLAEPVESLPVRLGKLLELAKLRPRLVGAAWLTPALDAALAFPPRCRSADAVPQGGHADVTTRGRPDQLLLSQFALDSDEFVRRFAERELLYFKPEEPHAPQPPDRVIVLDQGVRTWGGVRLALAGAAIALLRKLGKSVGPAYLVHSPDRDPVSLENISARELAEILESSDLTASPAETLANAIVSAGSSERPRDLILLTHPRSQFEPGVILAIGAKRDTDRVFALAVDGAGRAELNEWGARGPVKLRSFRVDLAGAEGIRVPEKREVRPPKLGRALPAWTGDVEPIGFPFRPGLVAEPTFFGFDGAGEWLVTASREGIVQAISLDGEPPEVLPRAYRDGSVLKSVEAILGTDDGVAICGRMTLNDESNFVNVVTSTVSGMEPAVISSATDFAPSSRSEWYVAAHYSRERRALAIHRLAKTKVTASVRWFVSRFRREIVIRSTSGFDPELNAGISLHTGKHFFLELRNDPTSLADAPPYRLPVWTKWSTDESFRRVPYLHLENQSFEVRLVSPAWPKFEPMREGKPLLGGTIVEGAQLANDVLVLATFSEGKRQKLVFRGPDARLVYQLPRWEGGTEYTLSPDGGLLAFKSRVSDVSIVETTAAALPRNVASTARLHNGLRVHFDSKPFRLTIGVGEFIHDFRIVEGALKHELRRGIWDGGKIGSRNVYLPYDDQRFPPKERIDTGTFQAVVDRLGQVVVKVGPIVVASFLIRRERAAVIATNDFCWGDPALLGCPATPEAVKRIGEWIESIGGTRP